MRITLTSWSITPYYLLPLMCYHTKPNKKYYILIQIHQLLLPDVVTFCLIRVMHYIKTSPGISHMIHKTS